MFYRIIFNNYLLLAFILKTQSRLIKAVFPTVEVSNLMRNLLVEVFQATVSSDLPQEWNSDFPLSYQV